MPRSTLLQAIQAANTDDPHPTKPTKTRKKPGPAPKVDQDGKRVLKSRATRNADLQTEEQRRAAADELNASIEAWVQEDEALKADVLAKRPGLEGDDLMTAIFVEQSRRHAEKYSQPAKQEEQAALQASAKPLKVTTRVYEPVYDILSPEFTGRSVTDVPEAAPAGTLPTVVETTFRIVGTHTEYLLQSLVEGRWVEERRGAELAHLAFHFTFRRISADEFHAIAATLPRYRPGRQAQLEKPASEVKQASNEDKFYVGKLEVPRRVVMGGAPSPPSSGGNWLDY